MRFGFAALLSCWLCLPGLGCEAKRDERPERYEPDARAPINLAAPSLAPRPAAAPASSQALLVARSLQAKRLGLALPSLREHAPRLAFGKGVLGQLTSAGLQVYDADDFHALANVPCAGPHALVTLVDGVLLAVCRDVCLRWDPEHKAAKVLPPLPLSPHAEVYADAQERDLVWVFNGAGHAPSLSSFRLAEASLGLLLPEQTLAFPPASPSVLGTTREGVWLFLAAGGLERFGPSGARLPRVTWPGAQVPLPNWVLPTRRLDQSLWLQQDGQLSRVLVSPTYKALAHVTLAGRPLAAAVGDEGRLLAVVVVTGEGPRFELQLFDADLVQTSRALLPSDPPTGDEGWVTEVAQRHGVTVAAGAARVAVGGAAEVTIYGAQGEQVFAIHSQ